MTENVPSEMDPERGRYLREVTVAVATRLVGQMLEDLAAPSTGSPSSAADRLMIKVIQPWIPKLRDTLLSKLSEADPVSVERIIGATATAIESILAQAPGTPLPRYRIDWDDQGALVLVPLDVAAA